MKRIFLLCLPVLLFAAAASPAGVAAYDKTAFAAPPGKALVVFIQNQKVDRKMVFTVFESDKRCVAEVGGREAQLLPVEPAPLIFYALGYNKTQRIEIFPAARSTPWNSRSPGIWPQNRNRRYGHAPMFSGSSCTHTIGTEAG